MRNDSSKNILLSICIPTYNQPKEVRRLLESLVHQITPEVELVVRDDSTNNKTKIIVNEFSQKVPIRYFHGKKEGLDAAIIFLTQEAKGDYVWWLGDDIMLDGAVGKIIKLVKQYPDISFIWLNSRDMNNENNIAFHIGEDRFFKNRDEVLETDIGMLGFISITIFKRLNALSGIESAKKYIGSAFVNLYLILHVLAGDGKQYFINKAYILSEPKLSGEKRWYDQFQVFCINIFRVASAFEGKFKKSSMEIALSKKLRQAIKGVLVERAMGFKTGFGSPLPKALPMIKFYWTYWEAWIALPFFLMPRFVLKFLYRIFKLVCFKNKNLQ